VGVKNMPILATGRWWPAQHDRGANKDDYHLRHVTLARIFRRDSRLAPGGRGDQCAKCGAALEIRKMVEIATYSSWVQILGLDGLRVLNADGKK